MKKKTIFEGANFHSSLQLKQAVGKRHGWAQTIILTCLNEKCEMEPYSFETSKKQKDNHYDINSQCVLGLRLIGRGHFVRSPRFWVDFSR